MPRVNPADYEIDDDQWEDFRSSVMQQVMGMLDSLYEVAKADCSLIASFEGLATLEGNSMIHQRTLVGGVPIDVDPNTDGSGQP